MPHLRQACGRGFRVLPLPHRRAALDGRRADLTEPRPRRGAPWIIPAFLVATLAVAVGARLARHPAAGRFSVTVPAMGSLANITIEADPAVADSILQRMRGLLLEIEIDTDAYGAGSLGTINRQGRGVAGPHAARLVEAAAALGRATGYALDPTIAPVVALWGFHGTPAVPDPAAVDSALALTGWEHVHVSGDTIILDPGSSLDLGAIAPGYAADMLYEMAVGMGAEAALVEVGGEIRCGGRPWTIAIRHPRSDGFWEVVEVADGAVSTSGDYENFVEVDGVRFCHILDPGTGWPEQGVASITVRAPTCLIADGLSTALAIRGPGLLDSLPDSLWSGALFLVVSGDTLVERRFGGM